MIMTRKREIARRVMQAAALCAALACIVLGVSRGEHAVVLKKAVRICLECIGVAG